VAELVDLVRAREADEPNFLRLEPADLREPEAVAVAAEDFPEALPLENRAIPLHYAYRPGQEDDGATLDLHVRDLPALPAHAVDWAVAGHLPAKVEHYLRALPKEQRRGLMPLAERVPAIAAAVAARGRRTERREALVDVLAAELRERHGLPVVPGVWSGDPLPDHLRVRIRVRDDAGTEVAVGRDLAHVRAAVAARERAAAEAMAREEPAVWREARRRWERPAQTSWTFGDVPARVPLADRAGVEVWAYPGLASVEGGVAQRLFPSPELAQAATAAGWPALLALELKRELAWLRRELRCDGALGALAATLVPAETLREEGFVAVRDWLLGDAPTALTAAAWAAARQRARSELPGLPARALERWRAVLGLRQELLVEPRPYPGLAEDLAALVPPDFLRRIPFGQLGHVPRYLKGMKLRCARWRRDPAKDAERARQLAPLAAAAAGRDGPVRWLVEELRVSLFAQELGTAVPVSVVKLERWLNGEPAPPIPAPGPGSPPTAHTPASAASGPAPVADPVPRPPAPAADPGASDPTVEAAAAPRAAATGRLKSFGALDRIFPRPGG